MATKYDMIGSLVSLGDTLTGRLGKAQASVKEDQRSAAAHASLVGRRTSALMALPDNSTKYAGIVAALDDASRAIVNASTVGERRAAVAAAEAAIAKVEQFLG